MLNSGKKNCALPDKKNKYSNSRVVRKNFLNETKNHNPPPLQVKWSVPYLTLNIRTMLNLTIFLLKRSHKMNK